LKGREGGWVGRMGSQGGRLGLRGRPRGRARRELVSELKEGGMEGDMPGCQWRTPKGLRGSLPVRRGGRGRPEREL
jgi:hypothetical protein